MSYLVLFLFLPHMRNRHCPPHLQSRKHLPETTAPSLHPLLRFHRSRNMTSAFDLVEVCPEFIHTAQYIVAKQATMRPVLSCPVDDSELGFCALRVKP